MMASPAAVVAQWEKKKKKIKQQIGGIKGLEARQAAGEKLEKNQLEKVRRIEETTKSCAVMLVLLPAVWWWCMGRVLARGQPVYIVCVAVVPWCCALCVVWCIETRTCLIY